MSGSNFTRKYTVSKHSGPVYINSYALKDIGVLYRNPTSSLDPIALPTGWVLPKLHNRFWVDLSLEKTVLEQARARRQAIVGEEPDPNSSLNVNHVSLARGGVPLIPYQSSDILTPVPISSESTVTENSSEALTKPLGEMSLRDFEGDTNDPFESTALQAIDVFSELQSVLQPELSTVPQQHQQSSGAQGPAPPPPTTNVPAHSTANVSATPPLYSFHTQPVVTSPPAVHTGGTTVLPPPPHNGPGNVSQGSRNNIRPPPGGVGVLVDFGRHNRPSHDMPPPPVPVNVPPTSTVPTPARPAPPPARPAPPPPVSPKPQARFRVSDPVPPYPLVPVLPSNQEPVPPPYTESYTPSYQADELYTTTPSSAYFNPSLPQFRLPDIQSSLSAEERETTTSISGMGFPPARVARAVKQYDGDNQAVLDFLFLVGELEEKGYNGDSAETALLCHDKDMNKSIEYLKQVDQYKEMWPEESIHGAYQESGKDWEKAVDLLTK